MKKKRTVAKRPIHKSIEEEVLTGSILLDGVLNEVINENTADATVGALTNDSDAESVSDDG